MDNSLTPRVLVTGAASGLGAALADAFEARGDRVLRTDRSLAGDGRLDVTSDTDWDRVHAWVRREWGGLDLLVNNAGVAGGGRLDVAEVEEWEWIFGINLFGMVRGLRRFVPMLKEQRAGHILNVASLAGLVHPAGMASYNAVKAAVVALSETAGHELAEFGVGCSVVCPSYFRTNLMDGLQGADTELGAVMGQLVTSSPLSAEGIAREVLAGLDRGEELIIPDEAACRAWRSKQEDRAGHDAVMRKQATKLNRMGRT